jgi:WD40 repeat protein
VRSDGPFVGPYPLTDPHFFFGRRQEVADLRDRLLGLRLVLLHAPSGAGKTSLIHAGLLPLLERQKYFSVRPVARVNRTQELRVGDSANRYVLSTLLSWDEALPADERSSPEDLAGLNLSDYLNRTMSQQFVRELLLFDQFEEVLTLDPTDVEAKLAFFRELGEALREPPRWALFAIRQDYAAALDPFLDLLPYRLQERFTLGFLSIEAAIDAMRGPAAAFEPSVDFTPEAAQLLADDLRKVNVQDSSGRTVKREGTYVEPVLLQVVCRRLWEKRTDRARIDESDVRRLGSVDRALADYYAGSVATVAEKTNVPERAIRAWVGRLITPQGTRRPLPLEPIEPEGDQSLPAAALQGLVDEHLIRRDDRNGTTWFELAHDRLIEPVQQDNDLSRKQLMPLHRLAPEWIKDRPMGLLLQGEELRFAQSYARKHPEDVLRAEQKFLSASTEAAAARRRWWIFRILLFTAMSIALAVVLFFWQQTTAAEKSAEAERNQAIMQADLANSRRLALGASDRLKDRLDISLLLSMESRNFTDTVEARSSLYEGLTQSPHLASFLWGEPQPAYAVAFSRDGRTVASAGQDGAIWLWNANTHQLLRSLAGHDGQRVTALAFSPTEDILASGGEDKQVRLWDLSSGQQMKESEVLTDSVAAVAFAPDGLMLVSAGKDGKIWLWDAVALAPIGPLPGGHAGAALAVAFSPRATGSVLFSVGSDGLVRRWDLLTRQEIMPPLSASTISKPLRAIAFTPQGDLVAAAGDDGTVFIWHLDSAGRDVDISRIEPQTEPNNEVSTTALAFSRDGRTLFWAGTGQTIHAWDVATSRDAYTLAGPTGAVNALALSADGRTLASAGEGKEAEGATRAVLADVRLWDVGSNWPMTTSLAVRAGVMTSVSVTHDGTILASGGSDGLIRLWDLPSGSPHGEPLRGHQGGVSDLAFSQVDGTLASVGTNGEVLLWGQPWEEPRILASGSAGSTGESRPRLAFSADGHALAVARGSQITIWDVNAKGGATAGPEQTLDAQPTIRALRFSPDGAVLAAGGCEATTKSGCRTPALRLWEMPTGSPLTITASLPALHTDPSALAFSTDGHTLATGYTDGEIQLWSWPTLVSLGPALPGSQSQVTGLAFSPDGFTLASTSNDGTVRLWVTPDLRPLGPPLWDARAAVDENDLAFSPDGRLLATASSSTLDLQLLDVDPSSWARLACTIANRNLTSLEWEQYLPGLSRRATCSNLSLDTP